MDWIQLLYLERGGLADAFSSMRQTAVSSLYKLLSCSCEKKDPSLEPLEESLRACRDWDFG